MMMKHYIAVAATALALAACSEKKEQPTPPAPKETPALQPVTLPQGFYKATSGGAELIDPAYGFNNVITTLGRNTCLRVIDGKTNAEHAHVELRLDKPPEERVRGYVRKDELRPAPECRKIAARGPFIGDPETPTGYRLLSDAFLYATTAGGGAVGHLLKGDCVKIEETRPSEQQTRLSATIEGRALSGWAFDAKIDLNTRCALGM